MTNKKLKLITHGSMIGYTISNIKVVFGSNEFTRFEKWMRGQTVGIYKGESLVYKYDFERFLEGLPVLD